MGAGIGTLAALVAALSQPAADGRALPFGSGWELRGERTKVEREGDREVLTMESGFAYRRDVELLDGTIEFDVKVTRRRSFVYLLFRMQEDREHEEIYLRPHKSGLPDATQYAPVWQGRSSWQLYHGPGGTSAVEFEPGRWTRVRLVVRGRRGALFVGDMRKPALLIPHLAREPKAGYIALRAFLPAGVPGEGPVASFSNVVVRPGVVDFDLAAAIEPASAPPAGIIRAWAVSRSFDPKAATTEIPGADVTGTFTRVDAEAGGLVELHRHVPIAAGMNNVAAVARIHVAAAQPGVRTLDLGFSDIATVFLNGRPIARLDASYSFDTPRRDGLIGFDQARLFLPLVAGDNELSIVLSDSFGGWGVMGRFPDADGLTIDAR